MSERDQLAFAARIRQPQGEALLPGITAERMAVYEGLFFNNIESFLSSGFPVLRRLFDDARWQRLVRSFIAGHRCATPYFLEIGAEFVGWLQQGFVAEADDPPFLLELAHYERVELELDVATDELPAQGWSPLAWPPMHAVHFSKNGGHAQNACCKVGSPIKINEINVAFKWGEGIFVSWI